MFAGERKCRAGKRTKNLRCETIAMIVYEHLETLSVNKNGRPSDTIHQAESFHERGANFSPEKSASECEQDEAYTTTPSLSLSTQPSL